MTSAPLPAPLPANCPLCNEPITWGDELWIHTDTDRCFLDGTTLHNDEEVRLWNRRAPEAQAWRAIETAPRDGTRILIADGRSTDAAYWSQCAKGYGGSKRYPWVILDETNGVNGMTETHPTHWQPLPAPPGATPAAPQAREAALVEALRFYADQSNWKRGPDEDWSQADTDGGQIARAALAEAEGRAGDE